MSLDRLLTVPRLTASLPTTKLVQNVSNTRLRLRLTNPPGGLKAHVLTSAVHRAVIADTVVEHDTMWVLLQG